MASLEYVVRPYQTPNAQGQIIIPSTPRGAAQRATIKWGAQSTLPQPVFAGVTMKCCDQKSKELSRTGETVRIHGSDGESYIDVFRANKLKLNHKTQTQGCDDPGWETSHAVQGVLTDFSSAVDALSSIWNDCDDELQLNNNTAAV